MRFTHTEPHEGAPGTLELITPRFGTVTWLEDFTPERCWRAGVALTGLCDVYSGVRYLAGLKEGEDLAARLGEVAHDGLLVGATIRVELIGPGDELTALQP